jgi:hypothetical protein
MLRLALVVLLVGGAYFASRQWAACVTSILGWPLDLIRICTFGFGSDYPRGPQPLWPDLLAATIYIVAAAAIAVTGGVHFESATRK